MAKSLKQALDDAEENKDNVATLPKNRKLKPFIDKLLNLDEKKNQITADIRSVYNDAADVGFDPKALKEVFGLKKKEISDEYKDTVNLYCEEIGLLPLFAHANK